MSSTDIRRTAKVRPQIASVYAGSQCDEVLNNTYTMSTNLWTLGKRGMERRQNMDRQDAISLIAVSLEALIHRRHVGSQKSLTCMPMGLLRLALDQLDEDGANTSAIRAQFMEQGFDLSGIQHDAEISERSSSAPDESICAAPISRVPTVIAEAIVAKYNEGWSKSRIAREFRLNRRTIIRICARHRWQFPSA